jgi:hypothetical protein
MLLRNENSHSRFINFNNSVVLDNIQKEFKTCFSLVTDVNFGGSYLYIVFFWNFQGNIHFVLESRFCSWS